MIQIAFTPEERQAIIAEATRRQKYNQARSVRGRNGGAEKGDAALTAHLLGAAGEMAVASYLGLKDFLFLETKPVKGSCDLPGNIDVKTRDRHNRDLIVQFDDSPNKNYWLVTIENKIIKIQGWISHAECTLERYKADPVGGRPAYFVPQRMLNRPETWNKTLNKEN